MTLEVDFHDKEGYIHANITGTFDKSSILTTFEKILLYSSEKNSSNIFFDLSKMEGGIPLADFAAMARRLETIHHNYEGMIFRKFRLAVLLNGEDKDINYSEIAKYEGKHDVILTEDHEEAINWLLSK